MVHAPPDAVVAVLTDFEAYPQWQTGIFETVVYERDEDGRGTLVGVGVDIKIRKIRYTVRYSYDLDHGRFGWDYVRGDLADCRGRYQLRAVPDGTEVTFDLVTDPGFPLPRPLMRVMRDQALRNAMRDLRRRLG